jgi:hypothetical protein
MHAHLDKQVRILKGKRVSVYYNPTSDVIEGKVGRKLHPSNNFSSAASQLRPGEFLYGAGDRLIFWNIVWLKNEAEFDYFYGQYASGSFVRFDLYALDEAAHQRALSQVT